jgi:hypothetical protein
MTLIEKALFQVGSAHWVRAIDWPNDDLTLDVHPCQRPEFIIQARFERVRLISMDNSYADEERWLPWDIIGFDSEPLSDGVWRFCLHTNSVEYVFESRWPQIIKPPGAD